MSSDPTVVRVMVVDDQTLIRDGFTRIINAQPDMSVIGVASDGQEAVDQTRELKPDVVLMDIRMPILDGIVATQTILGQNLAPGVKIVGLTTYDNDSYAIRMLRAGAVGFVLKDATASQLVAAVRAVHNGTSAFAASTTQRLIGHLPEESPAEPARVAALDDLTDRELEVFNCLITGDSNSEIAARLRIGEVTVKTHVSRVLAKLGMRDRVKLVIWAHQQGFSSGGSADPE